MPAIRYMHAQDSGRSIVCTGSLSGYENRKYSPRAEIKPTSLAFQDSAQTITPPRLLDITKTFCVRKQDNVTEWHITMNVYCRKSVPILI